MNERRSLQLLAEKYEQVSDEFYNRNKIGIAAAQKAGIKLTPVQDLQDSPDWYKTPNPEFIFIHDNSGRYTVVVDIGGVSVPFYVSTGSGGKASVDVDKWYPFFGIGPDGWLNKGSEAMINDFYGSAKLKHIAQTLDRTLGKPSRAKNVTGWSANPGNENYFIKTVNTGLNPVGHKDNSQSWIDNMNNLLKQVGGKFYKLAAQT